MRKFLVTAFAGLVGLCLAGTADAAPVGPAAVATAKVESGTLVQNVHYRRGHGRRHVYVARPYYYSAYDYRPHYRSYVPYRAYWAPRRRHHYSYGYARPYYASGVTIHIGRGYGRRHWRW
ncbi:MAG: hypothetical protein ACOYLQ_00955 [Hyphomicrobiaceae bacterium]